MAKYLLREVTAISVYVKLAIVKITSHISFVILHKTHHGLGMHEQHGKTSVSPFPRASAVFLQIIDRRQI